MENATTCQFGKVVTGSNFRANHSSGTTGGTARKLRDCHHFSSQICGLVPRQTRRVHQHNYNQLDFRYAHNTASRPVRRLLLVIGTACVCPTRFAHSADNQACKLTVPALMPRTNEPAYRISDSRQQMDDSLADLVPSAIRGKELRRFASQMGLASLAETEYERVTVSELSSGDRSHDTITVWFKNNNCKEP